MPVSADDVRRAYLHLLGREPESATVVAEKVRGYRDVWQMIEDIIASPEFRSRHHGGLVRPLRVDVPAAPIEVEITPADLGALLEHVRITWEQLGRKGAHHSVITSKDYLPENLAHNEAAFWASGEQQVEWLARILARHGMSALSQRTCIDFGCGVGRLTEPLARRFGAVHGYDISEPHLEVAAQRTASRTNVTLHRIRSVPAGLVRADVFFSLIVLQHNPPPIIALLIRDALACLRPGGLAVFQVPTYALGYHFVARDYLARARGRQKAMEMHCLPQEHVFRIVGQTGCEVIEVREQDMTGRFGEDVSNVFVIRASATAT